MDKLEKYIFTGEGSPKDALSANFHPATAKVLTREERDRRLGIRPDATCVHCGVKGHSFCEEYTGGIFGKV